MLSTRFSRLKIDHLIKIIGITQRLNKPRPVQKYALVFFIYASI
ncbi:hypothetical protein PPEP_a1589 [Pseudoalteromonas peptidolytica F12-50-A1]|uniref:Uncharacterized protein n=1 Tax=Pseudoalteromonas peptidolytica F12-50-A1 TaxID=1315280 RepID=A0A8I0MXW8_9GAMM|nr:hypothetical protein [Pseudoalteromonas peptidolytica F12-50-A1]